MNQWLNFNFIYKPVINLYYDSSFWKIVKELYSTEILTKELLERRTKMLLEILLKRVYTESSYFKNKLFESGYNPGGRFSRESFSSIIPMTKHEIRNSMSEMGSGSNKVSYRSTSGTTGEPLIFAKDRIASMYMDAAMHQVYGWYGIHPRDPEGRFWGSAITTRGKITQSLKDWLLNRRRLSSFRMGEEECESFWKLLRRFNPKYFYCYPNAACHFAEYLKATGKHGEELKLKVIICTGEILLPHQRSLLENVFQCPVANEYGSTENGILAFQCPDGRLHVMSQNILIEVVDEHGKPKINGEMGNILVTELHSHNIPFIRYALGDLGAFTGEECPCGRSYPVMEIQVGRIDGFIVTKSHKKVYDVILAYTFKKDFLKFRGYQRQVGKLYIEYIPRKNFDVSCLNMQSSSLKKYLGDDMIIEFKEVKEIKPLPSGKLTYFVSEIADEKLRF